MSETGGRAGEVVTLLSCVDVIQLPIWSKELRHTHVKPLSYSISSPERNLELWPLLASSSQYLTLVAAGYNIISQLV